MVKFVKTESPDQLRTLSELADEIWHDHFIPIIGKAQTDYMVEKFQSFEAMTRQIAEEGYSYYAIKADGETAGYFAIAERDGTLFLSKLYIHKNHRGRHYSGMAFDFMRRYCREKGLSKIWLTVNRRNDDTIKIYLHHGFVIVRTQVADIGNGFVMDDYIMEMSVKSE